MIGTDHYVGMKRRVCERIVADLPIYLAPVEGYADIAMDMERTLTEKMSGLSSATFEGMLHPVFQVIIAALHSNCPQLRSSDSPTPAFLHVAETGG